MRVRLLFALAFATAASGEGQPFFMQTLPGSAQSDGDVLH